MTHFQILLFSIILIALLFFAAFFSAAETSLMAINRYRLRHKARMRKTYAMKLLQLLKRPDRLLSAILIGSTFANMLASSIATLLAFHFWGENGALLAAMLLTLIVLIFAEIIPKTIAALYSDKVARWLLYPIQFFMKLLSPIVWLANIITRAVLKLLHISMNRQAIEPLSREELRSVVYDTSGKISRQYQNMLLGILDLSQLTVDDVMIPRHEITGINIEKPWDEIIADIHKYEHDAVPVYRDHINHVIGVLNARDILNFMLMQNQINKTLLEKVLQEPYFVPEGTPLNLQLSLFQQGVHKMAFIVDEYGDILGMITLKDILDEIIGDFTSTLTASKRIQLQVDGSYLVDGALTVREFNRTTSWELPLKGPRTLNGLIVEYLEALPHKDSSVLIAEYPIEIVQVKDNRVKVARVYPRLNRRGD